LQPTNPKNLCFNGSLGVFLISQRHRNQNDFNLGLQKTFFRHVLGLLGVGCLSGSFRLTSLKLTLSHLKRDGWNTGFLVEWPIFRGYVSFREGKFPQKLTHLISFQIVYSTGSEGEEECVSQNIKPIFIGGLSHQVHDFLKFTYCLFLGTIATKQTKTESSMLTPFSLYL